MYQRPSQPGYQGPQGPQQPPSPGYYPQQPPPPGYYPQQPQNPKGYAVTALILFLCAALLQIFSLIPFIGIFFGILALICDVIAIIFLILVIAKL